MLRVWANINPFCLSELHIVQTFRNEILRKIFGHKQDEASNLENYTGLTAWENPWPGYHSANLSLGWADFVGRMMDRKMQRKSWSESSCKVTAWVINANI